MLPLIFALTLLQGTPYGDEIPLLTLDAGHHHLGDDNTPEWPEASAEPEGMRFDLRFEAEPNASEVLLAIHLRHVDDPWTVRLNGHDIGLLQRGAEKHEQLLSVPAGTLRAGENELSVTCEKETDDIVIGDVRLILGSLRDYLDLRPVVVRVNDAESGGPLPARITIADRDGEHIRVYGFEGNEQLAVRQGVVYTSQGLARFELPAGSYRVYATRGMEWSLDQAALELTGEAREVRSVELALRHEVDTRGFIAADTHIHTLTFSGHGDSSVEERMVTLAGEGVELAISTDHNHNTDYRPYQGRMGLNEYFTPVVGNEVTTSNGHFNAFPLDPEDEVPAYEEKDWVKLVDGMRAKGAKVVILNHPRWPAHSTGPFGVFNLDRLSGRRASKTQFTFDAMELVNSTTKEEDPNFLFEDWFALLNRGEHIFAVGSSDSHTVGDPVGQGRTYVRSSTDDPARIDVDEACASFRAGQISVSQGIFCDVRVEQRFGPGEIASVSGDSVQVEVVVRCPSWIRAEQLTLYLNGEAAEVIPLPRMVEGESTDLLLPVTLPLPATDAHLVCLALGPGVDGPYWPTMNPYTLGATNPIFLDVDGDGAYSSPRDIAAKLIERVGTSPDALAAALIPVQRCIRVQALELAYEAYLNEAAGSLQRAARADESLEGFVEDLRREQ